MQHRNKANKRQARTNRVRRKVRGSSDRPRLQVYRSHQHIYAQIIGFQDGQTLVQASDVSVKAGTKTEKARQVGKKLAAEAKKKKIKQVKFDRGPYKYHGRVKALAEAAREHGLEF